MVKKILRKIQSYLIQDSLIYSLAAMTLFWTIFDSGLTYLAPVFIEQAGFSTTKIGIIIATSSIIGALFDVLACKIFKNTNFKRMFLIMFALCAIYPLLLWQAKTIWLWILAMAVWGIYYDLNAFGTFDYISRYTKIKSHSSNFGVISIFRSIGSIIGPLIVGLFISEKISFKPLSISWIFLVIGFLIFIALAIKSKKPLKKETSKPRKRRNFILEFKLFRKITKTMFPLFIITFFLYFIDAFFWTLAPLYAESFQFFDFGGIFLASYTAPILIIGWFVGKIVRKMGKEKTALYTLLIGSIILSLFMLAKNPLGIILITFSSSCFISLSLPSLNGLYTEFIAKNIVLEEEIEALEDFSFNLGYIFGPLCAGLLADNLSIPLAFTILGIAGIVLTLALFIKTRILKSKKLAKR